MVTGILTGADLGSTQALLLTNGPIVAGVKSLSSGCPLALRGRHSRNVIKRARLCLEIQPYSRGCGERKSSISFGLSAQNNMPSLPGSLLHLSGQLSPLLLLGPHLFFYNLRASVRTAKAHQ